ncbi:hypothetical protein AO411_2027230 [Salmonella enterica subsp. enterica serovar Sarajane]|nr:hypothetical protein AO411_2027230 [Salmonella enterica subsp. enterica serovar Sarajane]
MDFRLKMRRNTHFFVISYQMTCSHCAPDSNVHSYEIFKTMIHFPNHEHAKFLSPLFGVVSGKPPKFCGAVDEKKLILLPCIIAEIPTAPLYPD